jgi:bifunctional DNase/RNase
MSTEPETPESEEIPMIEIELGRLVLRDHSVSVPQYLHLHEVNGTRSFPIIISYPEAMEIQRIVTRRPTERPMTHQLMHDAITQLGASIARVDIVDVRKNTFYAKLVLQDETGQTLATLDARPSDSIALALRAKCPLRVAENVLDIVRTDESQDLNTDAAEEPEEPPAADPPPEAPDF